MAYVIEEDCLACGTCIDECPVGAISEGDIYVIDSESCTECGTCADVCPSEAITLEGYDYISSVSPQSGEMRMCQPQILNQERNKIKQK